MSSKRTPRALRIDDEWRGAEPGQGRLELGGLVGTWVNTDGGSSGGVARMVITERDGELRIRAFGIGDPEPRDWGEATGTPFSQTVDSSRAWAFNCTYEFDFLTTEVSAYNKEGILVIVTFNFFHDSSGRADYWSREFFYPLGA